MVSGQQQQATRIFCYGDSLTAGTSPPHFEDYPYAPYLQNACSSKNVAVHHRGLPGWTTGQLVEAATGPVGLRTALRAAAPVTIVVLLAGTNDLDFAPEQVIVKNLKTLHKMCHEEGVRHTVAVGIPPSSYDAMDKEYARKAAAANEALKEFCSKESSSTYVPFPFPYVPQGENWSPDGLHFTPKGYQVLGETLATVVEKLL